MLQRFARDLHSGAGDLGRAAESEQGDHEVIVVAAQNVERMALRVYLAHVPLHCYFGRQVVLNLRQVGQ